MSTLFTAAVPDQSPAIQVIKIEVPFVSLVVSKLKDLAAELV
jgi:hypothetical protein